MSRSTLNVSFAIAAIAALGTFALAPTSASAMRGGFGGGGFGGGGHMMMHGGGGGGGGFHGFGGGGHFVMMHNGGGGNGPHNGPHIGPNWPHHHWHPHWHYGWGVPYYGGVATTAYATPTYTTERRTDSCTCLTKEYLPDNSVLFKDVCTKESALAPATDDQGNVPGPQGYAQPQNQAR